MMKSTLVSVFNPDSAQRATTFAVLLSAAEGIFSSHRGPGQRVDLVIVATQTVHHLAALGHIDQDDHPIFVPESERQQESLSM